MTTSILLFCHLQNYLSWQKLLILVSFIVVFYTLLHDLNFGQELQQNG